MKTRYVVLLIAIGSLLLAAVITPQAFGAEPRLVRLPDQSAEPCNCPDCQAMQPVQAIEALPAPGPAVSTDTQAVLRQLLTELIQRQQAGDGGGDLSMRELVELLQMLRGQHHERFEMRSQHQYPPVSTDVEIGELIGQAPSGHETIVSGAPQVMMPATARHGLALPSHTRIYGPQASGMYHQAQVYPTRSSITTVDTRRKWTDLYRWIKGTTTTEVCGQLIEIEPCLFGPDRVRILQ